MGKGCRAGRRVAARGIPEGRSPDGTAATTPGRSRRREERFLDGLADGNDSLTPCGPNKRDVIVVEIFAIFGPPRIFPGGDGRRWSSDGPAFDFDVCMCRSVHLLGDGTSTKPGQWS